MRLLVLLTVCFAALSAPLQSAEGQLYRWVDEDGAVHYTDSLPPERARDGRRVYSRGGIAEEDIEAAPTEEERQALREEQRRQEEEAAAQRRAREEQAAYDRFLLRTYTGTEHIRRARESRLERLDHSRGLLQDRLERDRNDLSELRSQAAEAERGGHSEAALDTLYTRIERLQRRIDARERDLMELDREEDELLAEFQAHLERYRELEAEQR